MFKKNILNLISVIFLIVAILILLYCIYRSEIIWLGTNRSYYFIYYIFSLSLLLFSIFLFFIKRKNQLVFFANLFAVVLAIYTFETYLTFKKNNYTSNVSTNKFDEYKKIAKKSTLSVAIPPQYFLNKKNDIFPLSGHSNILTIMCNEDGTFAKYDSDNYGFNNPKFAWDERKLDYLLIGDSMTHGACVNRPNDIASILREITNKSALNLGYGGNGPLIEYATLVEYSKKFEIKKILWLYYEGNDLIELNNEIKNNILIKYINNNNFNQNLISKQDHINILIKNTLQLEISSQENKILFPFIKLESTRAGLNNTITSYKYKNNNKQLQNLETFIRIMNLTKEFSKEHKAELYFIYLPQHDRYLFKNFQNDNYSTILNIIKSLDINLINVHESIFLKEKKPLEFYQINPEGNYGHYNIAGYKKIAELIKYKTLQNN